MMTEFKRTQRDYPLSFKIAVVEPVEKGEIDLTQQKWTRNQVSKLSTRGDSHDKASINHKQDA